MLHQKILKRPETVVIEIVLPVALKGRQLDESGLYRAIIRNLRIYASYVQNRIPQERKEGGERVGNLCATNAAIDGGPIFFDF